MGGCRPGWRESGGPGGGAPAVRLRAAGGTKWGGVRGGAGANPPARSRAAEEWATEFEIGPLPMRAAPGGSSW
eukprot:1040138-Alexandrium_andersonii.AAC.1